MESLWIFLPLLGLFAAHAPVLRFDLLPQLRRPIDAGLTFRRRRIFGENKTWRGAFAMSGGVVAATIVLSFVPLWWNHLPAEVRASGPLVLGILLGLGSALAELPNSFLKRQLDIVPGAQRFSPPRGPPHHPRSGRLRPRSLGRSPPALDDAHRPRGRGIRGGGGGSPFPQRGRLRARHPEDSSLSAMPFLAIGLVVHFTRN
ncbi:MAG: CDP-archaeol synthase, partial [bacterium]